MINYQILNFNICRTLLAVVAEHGFLSPQFLTVSLMRVPIRSFGETNSALLRTRNATYWYIPGCDEQYRAPRTSSIHGSSSANIRNIIVSRDRARVRILILAVICWTRPRAQAVSTTAAAVQTSEKFGAIAVFEAFHSLVLHEEPSFYNAGTQYFPGTICRNMTVCATSCVVSTKNSIFHVVSCCIRMMASFRACVPTCLAHPSPASACGQATRWL